MKTPEVYDPYEDPQRYEQECIASLKERFAMVTGEMEAWGHRLIDVRLDGTYPHTRFVVFYLSQRAHREERIEVELWGNMFKGPGEYRAPPGTVASIVTSHLTEPR